MSVGLTFSIFAVSSDILLETLAAEARRETKIFTEINFSWNIFDIEQPQLLSVRQSEIKFN